MKKVWIVIPVSNVWNDQAIREQLRTHYADKHTATEKAKVLSKQYGDMYVFQMTDVVQYKYNLIECK